MIAGLDEEELQREIFIVEVLTTTQHRSCKSFILWLYKKTFLPSTLRLLCTTITS